MASGPQKPDHGGNFFMTPRRVVDSVAWRLMSSRARAVVQLFQHHHNGFNNGEIAITVHQIGKELGNQNHGANAKALSEAIEKGFLECISDADWHQSKAREYRITFIPTGLAKNMKRATHEYADWRPPAGQKKRKYGGARFATESASAVAVASTSGEYSVAVSSTHPTEIAGPAGAAGVVVSALPIGNQSSLVPFSFGKSTGTPSQHPAAGIGLNELRAWTSAVLATSGHGGQKVLSQDSGVPQSVLCKFKNGKGLAVRHRLNLQAACARRLPHKTWKAASGV